ncbi:MAG TPA: class I SAM-dependent methyltransferase, partial [Candidatus Latescibacteria bacterium]|nr:class I SAM-dependent methyltransferase [Candidatus Latescibacterota bacterium]
MKDSGGYESCPFVAEFYDQLPAYRNRPDILFYVHAAREASGPVLEIGCGTGRVLIPIARERIAITGLDSSPHMLAKCRESLSTEPEPIRSCAKLIQADMRRFDLDSTFNLVIVPFRAFQHLTTVEDQCSCLGAIHAHLSAKGKFILDIFNPWLVSLTESNSGRELGPDGEFTTQDGRKVVRWHK